ncbi:MAG: hypothetical protein HeimC3_23930 [Candidatus Heimdallarchaeota archaeon LC_3]|nr:MAG: hypothetical protein HeimC3_23930 [Candidatus Heimdallarchaeota archaeon LC_3]
MVVPDAGYYYLKDVGRLFGVYTLKTTNFLVIIIGTIGLLMTFATLIKQFSMIQNYFGSQFLQNSHIIIFQPILSLIIALVLLATVMNSAYISTIQKFLLF